MSEATTYRIDLSVLRIEMMPPQYKFNRETGYWDVYSWKVTHHVNGEKSFSTEKISSSRIDAC